MPREFYTKEKKQAILQAALDARAANKKWTEAHDAARELGYQGSLQGIIKLVRATEKRRGQSVRKPGRPKGSKNVSKALTAGLPSGGMDLSAITSYVEGLVRSQVNDALDRAIAVLQAAKS